MAVSTKSPAPSCRNCSRRVAPGDPRLKTHYTQWCTKCKMLVSMGSDAPATTLDDDAGGARKIPKMKRRASRASR
jgi:hypothetical protein